LASTLGRKALCPPTLIPRKKTIKAMLPIVAATKYRGEARVNVPFINTHAYRIVAHALLRAAFTLV
jgi:hypothetical protein